MAVVWVVPIRPCFGSASKRAIKVNKQVNPHLQIVRRFGVDRTRKDEKVFDCGYALIASRFEGFKVKLHAIRHRRRRWQDPRTVGTWLIRPWLISFYALKTIRDFSNIVGEAFVHHVVAEPTFENLTTCGKRTWNGRKHSPFEQTKYFCISEVCMFLRVTSSCKTLGITSRLMVYYRCMRKVFGYMVTWQRVSGSLGRIAES